MNIKLPIERVPTATLVEMFLDEASDVVNVRVTPARTETEVSTMRLGSDSSSSERATLR